MKPLQQRIQTLRRRLSHCRTESECEAIELELREIEKALRRQKRQSGRKAADGSGATAARDDASICVAVVTPSSTTYHTLSGDRVGEHLLVHPSMRTPHEIMEADAGRAQSYAITHLPTGQLIATVGTKNWAKRTAKEINKFSGPGIASGDVMEAQLAVGGHDMARAAYLIDVTDRSWAPGGERGRFLTYKQWSKETPALNPADAEDRKAKAAVGAAIGSLVGSLLGAVVGAVGGGALGLVAGGLIGGAEGAVGGMIFGAVLGIPIGGYIGTIWGAVRQTDKVLDGEEARSAKLAAGFGSAFFGPLGAGVGAYVGA